MYSISNRVWRYTNLYSHANPVLIEGDVFEVIIPFSREAITDGANPGANGANPGANERVIENDEHEMEENILSAIENNPKITQENDKLFGKEALGLDDQPEMTHLITKSGNYFNIEHRFFGESRPADMSNSDTKYWEYHTPENAANDYHKIFTTLAPVFGERWVSVGTSRGGLMTNVYAKYFPDDMMAYIPYVAPCSDGLDGDSMYRFVYEEIGDVAVCFKATGDRELVRYSFNAGEYRRGKTCKA